MADKSVQVTPENESATVHGLDNHTRLRRVVTVKESLRCLGNGEDSGNECLAVSWRPPVEGFVLEWACSGSSLTDVCVNFEIRAKLRGVVTGQR